MTDQRPVIPPWRTDFENAPSPCIGWCTPPAGDDVRQIWRHARDPNQWTAHSITQTVKAWQPMPSIDGYGAVAQDLPAVAAEAREPDAWQCRFNVAGWLPWHDLDMPTDRFCEKYQFNLDNGTCEIRPLYAAIPSVAQTWPDLREECANLQAMKEALEEQLAQQPTETRWRHKKRGSTYVLVGDCQVQAEEPLTDYEIAVVYRSEQDGSLWVRRRSEFHDGRFEAVALPSTTSKTPIIEPIDSTGLRGANKQAHTDHASQLSSTDREGGK